MSLSLLFNLTDMTFFNHKILSHLTVFNKLMHLFSYRRSTLLWPRHLFTVTFFITERCTFLNWLIDWSTGLNSGVLWERLSIQVPKKNFGSSSWSALNRPIRRHRFIIGQENLTSNSSIIWKYNSMYTILYLYKMKGMTSSSMSL